MLQIKIHNYLGFRVSVSQHNMRAVSAFPTAIWAHFKFWMWNQVSSLLYLRHFMSDWGVWGIVGTGSARGFRIWTKTNTKTKPNRAKTKNIAKTKVLVKFWATVICWVSKGMYWSWGIQCWPQMNDLNISKNKPNQTKTNDIAKTMVLTFLSPTVTCWVSKIMYSS